MVGFLNAFEISREEKFITAALRLWGFNQQRLVDRVHGEWFWRTKMEFDGKIVLLARANGEVFIYYGSSDTRTHVATTTVDKLLDYCQHTPPDGMRSKLCVEQRCELIGRNLRRRQ
jgi:hypothetical protein